MEVKLLDSILHGQLKPWKIDTSKSKRFAELIKVAKAATPKTVAELLSQLNSLLKDHPALQTSVALDTGSTSMLLHDLCYNTNLPGYKDTITQFYNLLITYETLRYYNTLLAKSEDWKEPVDIMYRIGKTLNNIKVLAIQSADELKERNFLTIPDQQSDLVHYTLYYLKHSLIALYFSVQEIFKESINSPMSLEDFYLLELEEPLSRIQPLDFADPGTSVQTNLNCDKKGKEKISFCFLGDKQKLKTMIVDLCREVQLLNEELTSVDHLLSVLTTKNITPDTIKIYLDCENTQFRYIVDGIALHFSNIRLSTIEKAGIFFSKNGTPLTSQNLSSGRVQNPKKKEDISNIIKQLK